MLKKVSNASRRVGNLPPQSRGTCGKDLAPRASRWQCRSIKYVGRGLSPQRAKKPPCNTENSMQNDCREITRRGCFFALARAPLAARFEARARCRLSRGPKAVPSTSLSRGMMFAAPPECVGVAPAQRKNGFPKSGSGTRWSGKCVQHRCTYWAQC